MRRRDADATTRYAQATSTIPVMRAALIIADDLLIEQRYTTSCHDS